MRPFLAIGAAMLAGASATMTACSAVSSKAPAPMAISLDDSPAIKDRLAQTKVAVIYSRDVQASDEVGGAVAFAGTKAVDGYIPARTVEHAAIAFDAGGALGFALEDELVSLGVTNRVYKRSPTTRNRGAVGLPLPGGGGSFFYYFNVGEEDDGRYIQTIESNLLDHPVVLGGQAMSVSNCPDVIFASVKADGTEPGVSSNQTATLAKNHSSPGFLLRPSSRETLTQSKDAVEPCRGGHVYSVRTPGSPGVKGQSHVLVDIDARTGRERRVNMKLPVRDVPKGVDDSVNQPDAISLVGNSLMWVTTDGRLFSTALNNGSTRRVANISSGSPSAWRLFSMQGDRIAVYEPYAPKRNLRIYDLITGNHQEDLDASVLAKTQEHLGADVIPTGIALAPS